MRVLHLLKTSVGAAWALRQTRELVKLGLEVHIALPEGPLLENYRIAGVIVHPLQFDFPVRKPWQCHRLFKALRSLVDTVQPDIIHSHFVGTTLTMRLALGKAHHIPRVFQVPGPLHLEHSFFKSMEIGISGSADYWIGSCEWTRQCYVAEGISDNRVFLSYYGTDIDRSGPTVGGGLRAELGVGPDTALIGMVSYMYAPKFYLGQTRGIKGHEDLIDAISICREMHPNLLGVFVGGGWNNAVGYEKKVRAYARKRCGKNCVFLGTRNDVPALYPDFDVAVHPSLSENVGGAVESMLMGVPTIASDVGGFPDLVKPGRTGWLVPAGHPGVLAQTILDVLSNPLPSRRIAESGRRLAREMFDIRQNACEIHAIYQAILVNHAKTNL